MTAEIEEHRPLVVQLATLLRRRLPASVDVDDLIQDGMIGLVKAIRGYDERKGTAFKTYASRRVYGAMIDGLRDRDFLSRNHRRKSDSAPVQMSIDMRPRRSRDAGKIAGIALESLSDPAGGDLLEKTATDARLEEMSRGLDPADRLMVRMYFGDGMTMAEISKAFGLCESRISQRMSAAIKILRSTLNEDGSYVTESQRRAHMNNGNGIMAKRNTESTTRTNRIEEVPALMEPPPWLKALRDSMAGAIKGSDLQEIMEAQVKKAKNGDRGAADFVFNQAHKMMAAEARKVTIVQNNYDTPARPDVPINPEDDRGTELAKLSARARAREPIAGQSKDQRLRPVSDEEEKAMRRRQEAERENEEPQRD